MKFCSFDIEIVKEIPEGITDWDSQRPLGISCAATICTGDPRPCLWFDGHYAPPGTHYGPQMTRDDCQEMVEYLTIRLKEGYVPLTWNGLSFDFRTLAEESGMHDECLELALGHVDMMFQLVCLQGYPVGLETCLKAMGLPGKEGMTGADAPRIWKTDPKAVLRYVAGDATGTLKLAEEVERRRHIGWTSKSGRAKLLPIKRWLTVHECLALPLPDTSWMSEPRSRESYYRWTQS